MRTVGQLLKDKGHEVWRVAPTTTVYDALGLMAEKGIGALIVSEGDVIAGLVSERDYARKVILEGRSSRDTPVSAIMTRAVLYATPEQSIPDCMSIMTEKKIRHLPVLEDGQLIGMISIGDLVKSIIAEQEFVIGQLETYISGTLA